MMNLGKLTKQPSFADPEANQKIASGRQQNIGGPGPGQSNGGSADKINLSNLSPNDPVYRLVKERDLLAEEVTFTRAERKYTSHCYELLQKYEEYAEEFSQKLQKGYDSSLEANSIIQNSIFEEAAVRFMNNSIEKK